MSYTEMINKLRLYTKMYNELSGNDVWLRRILLIKIKFYNDQINNLLRSMRHSTFGGGRYNYGLQL